MVEEGVCVCVCRISSRIQSKVIQICSKSGCGLVPPGGMYILCECCMRLG
jgi:hypothetical protein